MILLPHVKLMLGVNQCHFLLEKWPWH